MLFVIGLFLGTIVGTMIAGLCRSMAITETEQDRREQMRAVAGLRDVA
jgi:hypothetical protein